VTTIIQTVLGLEVLLPVEATSGKSAVCICKYVKPTIVMAKTPLIESLDAGIVCIVYSKIDNHFAIFIANTHHMDIFAEVL